MVTTQFSVDNIHSKNKVCQELQIFLLYTFQASQPPFTCSSSIMETLKESMKSDEHQNAYYLMYIRPGFIQKIIQ